MNLIKNPISQTRKAAKEKQRWQARIEPVQTSSTKRKKKKKKKKTKKKKKKNAKHFALRFVYS